MWLLGVTLSTTLDAFRTELFTILKEHVVQGRDLRILLLDALRSSAVFRVLLEGNTGQIGSILNHRRPRAARTSPNKDPYFSQPLYSRFHQTFESLSNAPELWSHVRYYAHAPQCWLVICDDRAYYRPALFGAPGGPGGPQGQLDFGSPLFLFTDGERQSWFSLLEAHFERLWNTSDTDVFHEALRIEDNDAIIAGVFDEHASWLNNAFEVVHRRQTDARRFPRLTCKYPNHFALSLHAGPVVVKDVQLINLSRQGVCVSLGEQRLSGSEGEISLRFEFLKRFRPPGLVSAVRYFEAQKFRVIWHLDGKYGLCTAGESPISEARSLLGPGGPSV